MEPHKYFHNASVKSGSVLPVPAFLKLPQKQICLQEETTVFFPEAAGALGMEKVSHCQSVHAPRPK